MKTWILALALLTALTTAAAQSYRGTGAADVRIDGGARRFHAFEMTVEAFALSTTTWRVGTANGWLRIDALFVEPDIEAGEPDDPAFALLGLVFYVDPATGQVAASEAYLPAIEFVPNQATYLPVYQGLDVATVVTVTAFVRDGDTLRVSGTVDAVLGVDRDQGGPGDLAATITIRGTFDLREVVPEDP